MQPRAYALGQTTFYVAAALFLAAICLGGGSSRGDVFSLIFVQVSAIGLLAAILLSIRLSDLNRLAVPLAFLSALAGVMIVQLVPLPPDLWLSLAGRSFYAEAAAAAAAAQPWRPISLAPDRTVESVLSLLPILAAVLALGLGSPSVRRAAAVALLWIIVFSALLAVLQQSGGPNSDLRFYRFTNRDAGVGLLANRNHQALLMAMGIPVAAWWALQPGRFFSSPPIRPAIGAGLILVCLLGALLTGSRTGMVVASIGLLSSIPLAWPVVGRLPRIVRASVALFFVCGLLAIVLLLPSVRLTSDVILADPRARFWPTVLDMIGTFMPIGAGFGTFDLVFPRFEDLSRLTPQYLNRAHNDFLEIGAEAGLAAYVLLLIYVSWWVVSSLRVWRAPLGKVRGLSLGRLGSILIGLCLFASLTDYPLRTPLLGAIFAAVSILLFASEREIRESR